MAAHARHGMAAGNQDVGARLIVNPNKVSQLEPRGPLPRVSIAIQYFRLHLYIPLLVRWRNCDGVELLVNVDSRTSFDLEWLNTTADRVVFSNNVHEIRAFNNMARMARAPIVVFVQDDMPAPMGCDWIDHMEHMFSSDARLGLVGWRTFALVPYFHKWQDHTYQRRTVAKLTWWGRTFRAQYAAMVDVGPLAARTEAFREAGGFNEHFSEPGHGGFYHDYEFSLRMWLVGWKVAFYDSSYNLCFDCFYTFLKSKVVDLRFTANTSVRSRQSYSDSSNEVDKNRSAIMRFMRPLYNNISEAVQQNNEQLGTGCTWGYPSAAHASNVSNPDLPPTVPRDQCCTAWGKGMHPNMALIAYMKNVSNLC